ncbi:MAG: DEAD/DEAH box helicase, partial [Bacteroidota bacterium]
MSDFRKTVHRLFSPAGPMAALHDFEYRSQQHTMAAAVAEALAARTHLIVEAPTGVGKTLAYLIPCILHALEQGRKAVVSTHTKNLQDQILYKDIPLVRAVLHKEFRAVALKGRRNYLCTTRLFNALGTPELLFEDEDLGELQRIQEWARSTDTGDVESLGFTPSARVWEAVCSERDVCSSAVCGTTCFFQRARERARTAELVVMNHALFFNLLTLYGSDDRYVFEDDFAVFDEAHTLEAAAGSAAGRRLSRYSILSALRRLYSRKTRRGLLAGHPRALRDECARTEHAVDEFFDLLGSAARSLAAPA